MIVTLSRKSLFIAALLAAMLLGVSHHVARAQLAGGIYQATTITTGNDTRFRAKGIAQCFVDVLVKASGEPRLRSDPRLPALVAQADKYVAFFSYRDQMEGIHHHDDQGTYDRPFELTVQFDWIAINAALASLATQPWTDERPTLVPIIAVNGHERPFDKSYLLSEDTEAANDQLSSLSTIASRYGLPLRVPSAADLASWRTLLADPQATRPPPRPDRVYIVGALDFRLATNGWVGRWRLNWRGVDYAWGASGVTFDKAFDNLASGAIRIVSGQGAPE